jgi:nuclear transport factor 2 (NTF2) superfamily protein
LEIIKICEFSGEQFEPKRPCQRFKDRAAHTAWRNTWRRRAAERVAAAESEVMKWKVAADLQKARAETLAALVQKRDAELAEARKRAW